MIKEFPNLISIIVPVFNVENYLRRCLDSIINQTYTNLEIIVVDDGSWDSCSQICDEFASRDMRIKVIHQENKGQSNARNIGLNKANGEYLGFVDSDDYLEIDYVERLWEAINRYDADISMCDFIKIDTEGNILDKSCILKSDVIEEEGFWQLSTTTGYMMHCIALWNKLFRKELWEGLRFIEGKYAEDNFAMNRYIPKAKRIVLINECMYYYIVRPESEMNRFTVKNLDSVEANIERIYYLESKGMRRYIISTLWRCAERLGRAYRELDMTDSTVFVRYKGLREEYKKAWKTVPLANIVTRNWWRCYLYRVNDTWFSFIYNFVINHMRFDRKHNQQLMKG